MAEGIIDIFDILSWFHKFNPYEHRNVEKPLSNLDAFFSLIKSLIGTGILALPLAFSYAGYVCGIILTLFISIIMTYGMILLLTCMVESSRRNNVGYMTLPETMEFAMDEGPNCCKCFSKSTGILVDILLGLAHYGTCVVYIVFVSENIKQICDYYFASTDVRILCAVVGPSLLPLFLIRHLKYLVPCNIVATALILGVIIGIFIYVFQDLPPLSDRDMSRTPLKWPLLFGIVLFAVSSVGVVIALEKNVAKPAEFISICGVFIQGTCLTVIVYIAFGFIGYWRYGTLIEGSITLNLPTRDIPAQVIKACMALAIYLTYPLVGYVTIDIIVNHCLNKKGTHAHPHRLEYIVRIAFVLVSTLNAIAFPNLGPLLALVGTLAISTLNLIFPSVIELCLLYHLTYGRFKWKLVKNIFMIIFGLITFFYGNYLALSDIIEAYG